MGCCMIALPITEILGREARTKEEEEKNRLSTRGQILQYRTKTKGLFRHNT